MSKEVSGCLTIVVLVAIVLAVIGVLVAYQPVEAGTAQVVLRYGQVSGVLHPGANWITPLVDSTVTYNTRVRTYETSFNPNESNADHTDFTVDTSTADGQQIDVAYSVKFRMDANDLQSIYTHIGNEGAVIENVIKDSRSIVRNEAKNHVALILYSGDVIKFEDEVTKDLVADFNAHGYGVELEDFLVREIIFSDEYVNAIENKQIEFEKIETAENLAQQALHEKQRLITLEEAKKQGTILAAEAEAEQIRLQADADAYAIEAKGIALRSNPEVLQWEFVSQLNNVKWGFLPTDSVTPFLPIPVEEITGAPSP